MKQIQVGKVEVEKIENGNRAIVADVLAAEEPLEIRLAYNQGTILIQKSVSITMRTPGHDEDLTLGFLFTEGILRNLADVVAVSPANLMCTEGNQDNIILVSLSPTANVDLQKLERHFYTSSSCGVCGKSSIQSIRTVKSASESTHTHNFQVSATLLHGLPTSLSNHQEVFGQTGGLHASALFDINWQILDVKEDVGRHNALDKLIGAAFLQQQLPLNNHILLLSGRASFELIQKAAMAGIQVVAAVGAPSTLAVQLAKEFDITLVGFLRDNRFNIYNGAQRIIS